MKKLFGLLVVVGFFAFTACGGGSKPEGDGAATVDTTAAPAGHDATPAHDAPAQDSTSHKEGDHKEDAHKEGTEKKGH